jgi:hypothetical protein
MLTLLKSVRLVFLTDAGERVQGELIERQRYG